MLCLVFGSIGNKGGEGVVTDLGAVVKATNRSSPLLLHLSDSIYYSYNEIAKSVV